MSIVVKRDNGNRFPVIMIINGTMRRLTIKGAIELRDKLDNVITERETCGAVNSQSPEDQEEDEKE